MMLSRSLALVVGLVAAASVHGGSVVEAPVTGAGPFLLVMERTEAGWRIPILDDDAGQDMRAVVERVEGVLPARIRAGEGEQLEGSAAFALSVGGGEAAAMLRAAFGHRDATIFMRTLGDATVVGLPLRSIDALSVAAICWDARETPVQARAAVHLCEVADVAIAPAGLADSRDAAGIAFVGSSSPFGAGVMARLDREPIPAPVPDLELQLGRALGRGQAVRLHEQNWDAARLGDAELVTASLTVSFPGEGDHETGPFAGQGWWLRTGRSMLALDEPHFADGPLADEKLAGPRVLVGGGRLLRHADVFVLERDPGDFGCGNHEIVVVPDGREPFRVITRCQVMGC